jgi:hypothetical protein
VLKERLDLEAVAEAREVLPEVDSEEQEVI